MNAANAFWLAADAWAVGEALRLDGDTLATVSRQRLRRVLRTAMKTDFYRERLWAAGVDVADPAISRDPVALLAAFPPASKHELREAGNAVLAGGRVRSSWQSSRSSGSTGEPFRVYYDARAWATLKYLVKMRARLACGMRLTDRVASLEAVSLAELQGDGLPSRARPLARLNVLRPAEEVAAALVHYNPDIVTGLPSALLDAGLALRARDASLPAVRAVFTGGELLQRATREQLERTYGTRVFDVYGTSETKEIAWECRLGGMHVNADVVYIEIVDQAGRALPPGEEGEIVATLLVNHAMPLLRYRTGDWGSLRATRCACGRATPLLGVGTGRETDTLVFEGGRRVSPYALTCTLEQVPGLTRYQVVQLGPSRLSVRAILSPDADPIAVEHRVRTTLHSDVASFLDVDVEFVDALPTGPRAKFRVVQRLETS